jgi:hypothetical protein
VNEQNLTPWPKGVSGNPAGKLPGTRSLLSKGYIADFHTVWQESGIECVRRLAKKSPEAFVALAGKLVPNDVRVAIEQTYGGLSPEDLSILVAIREAIPDANSRSPTDVLQHTLHAIRQANANVIEIPAETADPKTEGAVSENT